MTPLWAVFRTEWLLLRRGWGGWICALIVVLLGIWTGSMIRERPYTAWNEFVFTAFLLTLILTLTTGDGLRRDRTRRVDGVILSAPIPSITLVLGKYFAALTLLLALAGVGLFAALLTDSFYELRDFPVALGNSYFPPLGARPYMIGWGLLFVVPLIFGAALMLSCLTLVSGGRAVAAIIAIALWVLPAFSGNWPATLDLSQLSAATRQEMAYDDEAMALVRAGLSQAYDRRPPSGRWQDPYEALPGELTTRVVVLSRAHFPPGLPARFYWNRVAYLTLSVVLVGATVAGVARQRRASA